MSVHCIHEYSKTKIFLAFSQFVYCFTCYSNTGNLQNVTLSYHVIESCYFAFAQVHTFIDAHFRDYELHGDVMVRCQMQGCCVAYDLRRHYYNTRVNF